ncbi:MAG: response regulator [Deltaproteobacteria bacterium]|jgi:putative two-component system response regulator|nr:response regulator [Deltaproteobacteria bacterium]
METRRHKIMLVDDNMANLTMGKTMLKNLYEVYAMPSAAKLFELLEHVTPDLILLDVIMPEMDGYEAIRRLKADPVLADIPVIFITSKNDELSELEGLSLGAIDYIGKPFSAALLLRRIENHLLLVSQKKSLKNYNDNLKDMVNKKTGQIFELQNAVLSTVADMLEFRDDATGGHVSRTQMYLELLVDKLQQEQIYTREIAAWDMDFLIASAQLHDVGKIAISDAILNKPGRLTPEEFAQMQKHVSIGVEAIDRIAKKTSEHSFLLHARTIAGTHHEKWDGTGYPAGLRGADIPLEGRLMAIADVYDALISKRPYKQPVTTAEAERIIIEERGSHFDPVLVDVFQSVAGYFADIANNCR